MSISLQDMVSVGNNAIQYQFPNGPLNRFGRSSFRMLSVWVGILGANSCIVGQDGKADLEYVVVGEFFQISSCLSTDSEINIFSWGKLKTTVATSG